MYFIFFFLKKCWNVIIVDSSLLLSNNNCVYRRCRRELSFAGLSCYFSDRMSHKWKLWVCSMSRSWQRGASGVADEFLHHPSNSTIATKGNTVEETRWWGAKKREGIIILRASIFNWFEMRTRSISVSRGAVDDDGLDSRSVEDRSGARIPCHVVVRKTI